MDPEKSLTEYPIKRMSLKVLYRNQRSQTSVTSTFDRRNVFDKGFAQENIL
jgi:hypothetical protein